jgi:hypothetical protein
MEIANLKIIPMKTKHLLNITLTSETEVFTPELMAIEERLQQTQPGEQLKLCLIGPCKLPTDTVLALYEIIMARPLGVRLHVHSHSWLEGAEVLVWLAGDTRTLRPGAWIHFRDLASRLAECKRDRKWLHLILEEEEMPFEWTPVHINYAQVERLIKKHLPEHLFNRRVWAGELAEWHILRPAVSDKTG